MLMGCSHAHQILDMQSASFLALLPAGEAVEIHTVDSVYAVDTDALINSNSERNDDTLRWRTPVSFGDYRTQYLALQDITGFSVDQKLHLVLNDGSTYDIDGLQWYIGNDNGRAGSIKASVYIYDARSGRGIIKKLHLEPDEIKELKIGWGSALLNVIMVAGLLGLMYIALMNVENPMY